MTYRVRMRLIYPYQDPPPAPLDDEQLARVYAYPDGVDQRHPWLRANFVTTLDGAATGPDGRAGSINTAPDRDVFALLRSLADVILVGAGTARTEGYGPPEPDARWSAHRSGRPRRPAMAVVTRSGDLPPLLQQPSETVVFLVTCASAPERAVRQAQERLGEDRVIVHGDESADLREVVPALAERGLPRILCEGGPHLIRDVVADGVLDELCLTMSPTLLGGEHPRILTGAPVDADLTLQTVVEAEGSLLGRWVRA